MNLFVDLVGTAEDVCVVLLERASPHQTRERARQLVSVTCAELA
jgi:hypothetical protein